MRVFGIDSRTVQMWGPTASVMVKVEALGGVVGNSWLLDNMRVGAREIVDVRQCFNDVSYIYALGNNQSSCLISLSFVILIGRKNCQFNSNMDVIASGLNSYRGNRISEKTSKGKITIGSFSKSGWLIGIEVGGIDPSRGICHGTVTFSMEL